MNQIETCLENLENARDVLLTAQGEQATAERELAVAKTVLDTAKAATPPDATAIATAQTNFDKATEKATEAKKATNRAKAGVIAAEGSLKRAQDLLTTPPAPPKATNGGWFATITGLLVAALILLGIIAFGVWRWSAGGNTPVQVTAVTAPAPAPTVATTTPTPPGAPVDPSTLALLGGPDWTTCNEGESWCLHYGADRWGFFLRNTEVKPVCWESGSSAINSAPVPCIVDKTTGNAVTAACLPSDPTESRPATAVCPEVVATNHRLNG